MPEITSEIEQSNPLKERLNLIELSGGILMSGLQLTYAGTFLLLSFRSLSFFWRLTALTTEGLLLWIGMIGQFRSVLAWVVAAAVLGFFYIPLRVREGNLQKRKLRLALPLLGVSSALIAISASSSLSDKGNVPSTVVLEYVEAITKRCFSTADEGFHGSVDIRIEESNEALSEQSIVQLVVGKGIGATWSGGTMYAERRDMLHLGIVHLVLHGGILLALFVLLGPALRAVWVFLKSRSEIPLVCASMLCLALAGTLISNIFSPSLSYLLLSLCVGGSLLHSKASSSLIGREKADV